MDFHIFLIQTLYQVEEAFFLNVEIQVGFRVNRAKKEEVVSKSFSLRSNVLGLGHDVKEIPKRMADGKVMDFYGVLSGDSRIIGITLNLKERF